jgi:hypothetical protein
MKRLRHAHDQTRVTSKTAVYKYPQNYDALENLEERILLQLDRSAANISGGQQNFHNTVPRIPDGRFALYKSVDYSGRVSRDGTPNLFSQMIVPRLPLKSSSYHPKNRKPKSLKVSLSCKRCECIHIRPPPPQHPPHHTTPHHTARHHHPNTRTTYTPQATPSATTLATPKPMTAFTM